MKHYILKTPVARNEGAVFFDRSDQVGHDPGRGSITTGSIGNYMTGNGASPNFVPPVFVTDLSVVDVNVSTLTCENLSRYGVFKGGLYEGGQIFVSRVVNDIITEVGVYDVQSANIRQVSLLSGTGKVLESGEFRWSPPKYHRPNATEYFAVAQIDANGDRGPLSDIVSFDVSPNPDKQSPSNSTVDGVSYSGAENATLSAPTGVSVTPEDAGLTALIQWTAEVGKQYIVLWSSDAEFDTISQLTLAQGQPDISTDDLVVFKAQIDHTKPKADLISNRIWGVGNEQKMFGVPGLASFNEDLEQGSFSFEVDTDGEPYVRLQAEAGETLTLQRYSHVGAGGTDNGTYQMIVPDRIYNLTLHGRVAGTGLLEADMVDVAGYSPVNLGAEFGTDTVQFSTATSPSGSSPRPTRLRLTGPLTLDLKLFALYDDQADFLYWTQRELNAMAAAQPRFTRLHFSVKSKPDSFDVRTMIRSLGTRFTKTNGLHRSLENLQLANAHDGGTHAPTSPWAQIPWHFTDDELRFLSGYFYMASPSASDTTEEAEGARLRIQLGQVTPWSDVFDEVMWEVENENWNGLDVFYTLPSVSGYSAGQINARMLDRMAGIFQSGTGYNPEKSKYYIGLWAKGQGSWNEASLESVHADFGGYADYTGGWDVESTPPGDLSNPGNVAGLAANNYIRERQDRIDTLVAECSTASEGRAKPVLAMYYEQGPGYQISGLNGSTVTAQQALAQEAFSKGWVGGAANFAAFLLNSAGGIMSPNFFTFGAGDYFNSHTVEKFGGAASAAWQWFTFMQQHLLGEVSALTTEHFTRHSNYEPANDRPVCSAYRINTKNDGRSYVLVNHDAENAHTASVFVKDTLPAYAQIARMSGNIGASNTTETSKDDLRINVSDASNLVHGPKITVPLAAGEAAVILLNAAEV